jgi:transposase
VEMMQHRQVRYIGLDVHRASIAVAIAEEAGAPTSNGNIANDPSAIRKLMARLGGPDVELRVAYEAGPTGYALHRQLASMGIECMVVAPSLIPKRPGDKVKTDRRDALKLARLLRSGDLTPVWVPDEAHEALRNLVRARADAKADQAAGQASAEQVSAAPGLLAASWRPQLVAASCAVVAAARVRARPRPGRLCRLLGRGDRGW